MSWIDGVQARLRDLLRGSSEARMDEELRFHIERETEKNIRAGMAESEARRRAVLAFGGVERVREEVRSGRPLSWLEDAVRDARYAWRSLWRAPGFALGVVLTIGLGIGANTAIFGVVDALFLRSPEGVRQPQSVVRLYIARDEGMVQTGEYGGAGSFLDYRAIRRRVPAFAETAAFFSARELDLDRGPQARRIRGSIVTHTFLPMLGVGAARGRLFMAEEDSIVGAHPVALISHGFWGRHFGSDPAVLGETLMLNGQRLTIIGVLQEDFTGIEADPVDVWVPMAMASPLGITGMAEWRELEGMIMVNVIGRLRDGASAEAAASAAETALRQMAESYPQLDPTPTVLTGTLVPAGAPAPSPAADLALWLMLITGFVLVIACANVANLLLSRAAGRRRETAIRLSIGAGRWRVVRQHLTESVVIAALGAGFGLLVALWSARLIAQFPVPPAAAELSGRPLLFALTLALLTAFLFGLAPALQAGRADPGGALKERRGGGPRGRRLRRTLIGLQVSLSLVLLVGTGLFVRSLREVLAIDPGIDTERLLLVSADLRKAGFDDAEREAFYAAARERALRIAGVEAAAMTHFAPFARVAYGIDVDLPGPDTLVFQDGPFVNWAGSGYFAAVGTRVLRGRAFEAVDRTGERAAVINESFARLLPSGTEPVGTCLAVLGAPQDCTRVIGVVENQRRAYLEGDVAPHIYLARERDPHAISWGGPTLVVRTRGEAAELAAPVRAALQGLDPRLPFVSVEPATASIRSELLPYRLGATLFTLFGLLALALAAVGLYGVLGYFIAERRPEIGIRRSLGAQERDLVRWVIREGMAPVLVGAAAGLAAAFAGTRLIESLLYGVDARDPVAFGAAALFLFAVALLACWLPGRRATRVDPMVALRAE